jgi:ATP-dependent helicase HrpB
MTDIPKLPEYPIGSIRRDILEKLADKKTHGPGLVISAPPGSGKSTLVPLFLLGASWRKEGQIIVTQPRRAAVRSVARRLDTLSGPGIGVGYAVRGEMKVPRNADIVVMTEGILIRRLQEDPEMSGVSVILLDEFHERSIHTDTALALLLQCREAFRPDLRLLLMSATLEADLPSRLGMTELRAEGRRYPVEVRYRPHDPGDYPPHNAADQAWEAVAGGSRGVLVFLPGEGEISAAASRLRERADPSQISILPLYGRLSPSEQQKAIEAPNGGRAKIVLATNVAETSLTIEGIDTVIDTGLRKIRRYDPAIGVGRLVSDRVSSASAEQRAGRAGRLGPGRALRLWSETERLEASDLPEILREELSSLILTLADWGDWNPESYFWLNPPPGPAVSEARLLLEQLGALDERGNITSSGRLMSRLPIHPRLASMVLDAPKNQRSQAARLAAIVENGDPLTREAAESSGADIDDRRRQAQPSSGRYKAPILRLIEADSRRILTLMPAVESETDHPAGDELSSGALLAAAYPDRIGRREADGSYLLSSGGLYTMRDAGGLFAPEWIVAADLHRSLRGGSIYMAGAISDADLELILRRRSVSEQRLEIDPQGQLKAYRIKRLGVINLQSQPIPIEDIENPVERVNMLIRKHGVDAMGWNPRARSLQARLDFLHHSLGDPWPAVDDASLAESAHRWLEFNLPSPLTKNALSRVSMTSVLQSILPWELTSRIEELAPEHFTLPSGSRQRLRYASDRVILSARIQQLFGLSNTPLIAGEPVEIELLSPARRPIQITRDLRSFWENTYAEVRKELRGRYTKHYWPENPLSARATDGIRPK